MTIKGRVEIATSKITFRERVRQLKAETWVLYLAYRDHRTPWYARLVAVCVVAYAFSPLDLIPDFIPVLGLLDDLILVPLGIILARKLIPPQVLADCRAHGDVLRKSGKPKNWVAAGVIVAIWLLLAALSIFWLARIFS